MTLILGLTGGIACGKSNISSMLQELGAVIIDGDRLSRELTAPQGRALPGLRSVFGDEVFFADGQLNRKALAARVFGHPEALAELDALMQPLIRELTLERIAEAKKNDAAVCVLDMPLLYEKELDSLCDRVWCAWLPREMQLTRLIARDGCTTEEAEARLNSQMPSDEKARLADVVIHTDGSIEETRAMIPGLLKKELNGRLP